MAHEISSPPVPHRPSNDSHFLPRLRGFSITCRFKNGSVVTMPAIALHSSQAIQHIDEQFPEQIKGYKVKAL